jgi:NAD(P) transhydrogenase subunit alpha
VHITVLKELARRERRVALTPDGVVKLVKLGHDVTVEAGCGRLAGFGDDAYSAAGATVTDRQLALARPGVVAGIDAVCDAVGAEHTVIGLVDPLWRAAEAEQLAATGATVLSLDLIPRITRAQSMDVLSSMATVAGYEAVLLAAARLPKMFPLLMTAAGTVPAARTLVLGAGVAGLQAIATAKRLGSLVEAYDVRPVAAEQIESVGGKSITLDLDTAQTEDSGGYARSQGEDVNVRQQQMLGPYVAKADVVITTAAIPGVRSPELVTTPMVEQMRPGSVIVDLAAERGGNCSLTRADEEVEHRGVTILGPTDLESRSATSASQMFSNNVVTLLKHLTDEAGNLVIDSEDEITAGTLVARAGQVVHPQVVDAIAKLAGETS